MSGKFTVISTFAGCGGSSLGYKWAGFKELLAIDYDKNAVETFKMNFSDELGKISLSIIEYRSKTEFKVLLF